MTSKETKKNPLLRQEDESFNDYTLLLHNDDVHSFDYVINALIDICKHTFEQAEQCSLITHYKGSCDIYKGEFKTLKKMKNALIAMNLNATIEVL